MTSSDFQVPSRLFIKGIPKDVPEVELLHFFEQKYGEVRSLNIMQDVGGMRRGFGFVTFDSQKVADRLVNVTIQFKPGVPLFLTPAKKKSEREMSNPSKSQGSNILSDDEVMDLTSSNSNKVDLLTASKLIQEAFNRGFHQGLTQGTRLLSNGDKDSNLQPHLYALLDDNPRAPSRLNLNPPYWPSSTNL